MDLFTTFTTVFFLFNPSLPLTSLFRRQISLNHLDKSKQPLKTLKKCEIKTKGNKIEQVKAPYFAFSPFQRTDAQNPPLHCNQTQKTLPSPASPFTMAIT